MLDIKFIRENPDIVRENIKKKFQDAKLPLVDEVIDLDAKRRAAIVEADQLRSNRNQLSKQIGVLMGQAKKDPSKLAEAEAVKAQVKEQADRLAELEKLEVELENELHKRLLVIPQWETADTKGRVPLILDPGLTFGTGSHATTRLCLTALERRIRGGEKVLDLGCGSGILSIAALRLGAASAFACDIDDKCLKVAYENASLNGIGPDTYTVKVGDILTDAALQVEIGTGYDLVVANIVADVIIALAPAVRPLLKENGVFLCSGIIDDRAEEVAGKLREAGLEILETHASEGWFSYLCR